MTEEHDTTEEVEEVDDVRLDLDLELPDYHGRVPVGMKTGITGAGNRLSRPHGIGDRVVLVIEAKCKKAGHEDTDDGLIYAETMKVVDLFEIHGDPGARLLSTLRSAYRTAKDDLDGKVPFPDLGAAGYTDASGVVLTDREVAALRGDDPIRALVSDELTPAVVIYDDGSRLLWPDEYPTGTARPAVGSVEFDAAVVDLLHHATGESMIPRVETYPDATIETSEGPVEVRNVTISTSPDPVLEENVIPDDDPVLDETPVDDGGYGDVPDYDDVPDTSNDLPALPGEEQLERELPTSADFTFVDTTVPNLKDKLGAIDDLDHLRRLVNAEKQGRGRGLQYRKSALDAIHARIAGVDGSAT